MNYNIGDKDSKGNSMMIQETTQEVTVHKNKLR